MQVAQRGVAGAEIVERRADAGVLQADEDVARARRIVEQRAFGDLGQQPRRVQAGTRQQPGQPGVEIGVAEMQRGDVDGQVGVGLGEPGGALAAEREHAPVDRLDHAAFLGDLQERRRAEHAAAGVVPAQQRLVADDLARGQAHHRLEIRLELVLLQRLAQLAFQREHVDRLALHRRVEQHVAFAAERLGAVQRGVGIAQQFLG